MTNWMGPSLSLRNVWRRYGCLIFTHPFEQMNVSILSLLTNFISGCVVFLPVWRTTVMKKCRVFLCLEEDCQHVERDCSNFSFATTYLLYLLLASNLKRAEFSISLKLSLDFVFSSFSLQTQEELERETTAPSCCETTKKKNKGKQLQRLFYQDTVHILK